MIIRRTEPRPQETHTQKTSRFAYDGQETGDASISSDLRGAYTQTDSSGGSTRTGTKSAAYACVDLCSGKAVEDGVIWHRKVSYQMTLTVMRKNIVGLRLSSVDHAALHQQLMRPRSSLTYLPTYV